VALEGGERTPLLEAAGFWLGNLQEKATIKAGFYPDMNCCHCQRPPVWADGGSGAPAASLSQPGMPSDVLDLFALQIADSAFEVRLAAPKLGVGSDALPTAATSRVWRAGSITAIGNVRTGNVTRRLA